MTTRHRPIVQPLRGSTKPEALVLDAIVLAGGRSSRLGGTPKSSLRLGGRSLLARTLAAVADARMTVVVGDVASEGGTVLRAREDPPFGGPAAGIGAGLTALARATDEASDYIVVLACDMPAVAESLSCLRQALSGSHGTTPVSADAPDGFIAVAVDGRLQPLVAIYATGALATVVAEANRRAGLTGASVFGLISGLDLRQVTVPAGSTDDVDTWQDAARFGIEQAGISPLS
ncbi:molybdenum cofactor guanylyltransferase [Homoserinimonas sp. OAct 916]|uniref:molybdenum cofactor guanylyltransferase n=1 Tax=Homoserinimonas sp. OAct 916 TaxID=2211450 RepID=UPI001E4CB659|nr:NTP transferase domain-containing protein [Homoserinimonas sp. OAct 916]